jgi:DNA-binding FadR family transcriptional regulator
MGLRTVKKKQAYKEAAAHCRRQLAKGRRKPGECNPMASSLERRLSPPLSTALIQHNLPVEIFEIRKAIGPEIAILAARRATAIAIGRRFRPENRREQASHAAAPHRQRPEDPETRSNADEGRRNRAA